MRVRMKDNPEISFEASMFNVHGIGEVIGFGETFGSDLFFIRDLDVFIDGRNEDGRNKVGEMVGWKDMRQAFKDHDLIIDNHNTRFFEPENMTDKKRGYTL